MLTFKCSACKKKIVTEDGLAGQQGECPFCKKVVTAPGTARDDKAGANRDAPRCPKCGARRKDSAPTCAFCGASIGAPKTRRMEMPQIEGVDKKKVLMLGGLVAAAVVVAYIMFSGGEEAPKIPPDDQCRRQMLFLMDNASVMPGGMPLTVGSQFWIDVATKQNAQVLIKCPTGGKGRRSDYRGPAKPIAECKEGDVVLVCHAGNHPGGVNVMYRSGALAWATEGSDVYKTALADSKE